MGITIGRLSLDDPEGFPEPVGESIARIGAAPIPGARSGLSVSAALTSFPSTTGDTAADRQRVRRQLRSLVNNLPMRLQGVYVAWTEDDEQNGWYVPGTASFDVAGPSGLVSSFWRFTGVELALVGRRRTHRRGVVAYLRDLRTSTTPRDYLKRIYSTDFSGTLTPIALTWLPSTVSDVTVNGGGSLANLSAARTGYGGATLQAVIDADDLSVISFDQAEASRNLGDVVAYDRRGTLSLTSSGPTTGWEEMYGPDWPLSSSDVPVLDNSLCRVSYDSTNTDGFILERWDGGTWDEIGKVLIWRYAASDAFCDSLVSADLVEWAPDRAIVRAVMEVAADATSREEVYITLQRGWSGPRFEVYPATYGAGTTAGASIAFHAFDANAGTSYARKEDAAGLVTVTGTPNFSSGTIGASSFNDENWVAFSPGGGPAQITVAVLQKDAVAWRFSATEAYGSARNGISVDHETAGYISAHFGMVTHTGGTLVEQRRTGGTNDYLGCQDLGDSILYDSRSPQTVVSR